MGINNNVFASRSERGNFYKLSRQWGDKYRLYHNLPFLNVLNPKDIFDFSDWYKPRKITLTGQETARLKKTSIDYTLCNQDDAPLLCVEFDGLQEGFNVGADYHPRGPFDPYLNPWRQEITELKLKVAWGSLFPYFVVGSEQFQDITPDIKVTIMDGIIGEVLANHRAHERFAKGLDYEDLGVSEAEFAQLPPWDQDELVQNWALSIEVDCDMENNPVTRSRWEVGKDQAGFYPYWSEYLHIPPIPDQIPLRDRARAIDRALLNGARVVLETPDCGNVEATAWIPNFKVIGFSGLTLVENIAYILAVDKVRKTRKDK